mmetsp:Transcript_74105/g.119576  ORF Transcript_74105/g.119576 Transcript_74105/m.119576 type:complete len:106 (+) Transcript_74105:3-320(+)
MGGSLGGIGVLCTSMMASSMPGTRSQAWPPAWLPRRCAGVALLGGILSAGSSWLASRELVGQFVISQWTEGGETVHEGDNGPGSIAASATPVTFTDHSGGVDRTV